MLTDSEWDRLEMMLKEVVKQEVAAVLHPTVPLHGTLAGEPIPWSGPVIVSAHSKES